MSDPNSPGEVFRYCPRCGSHDFMPDTVRSHRCGHCGFQYFFNMAAAVAALIYDSQGRLLMTYRANEPGKGKLDLPGGFVDPGETAEEALKREIREELSIDVTPGRFIGSFPNRYLYGGFLYQTLDLVFACEGADLDAIRRADDVSGYIFAFRDQIPMEDIGLDSIRRIIESLRK